ncbi:MAG: phosphatase PAP2 family protein [Ruminococcus sp.]|nr:phosphatase PAP2 family protein [Ruminococcus sp.]
MDIFQGFDFSILDFIYNYIRCDFLDPIMAGASYFASNGIGWIVLGFILLIPRKTRAAAATALVAIAIGFFFGEVVIKNIVCRIRPYDAYEAFHCAVMPFSLNAGKETSFSFPSGHTCCSFASAISCFKINRKVGLITLFAAGLIGFSRLYNYVHYPTDVLGGMLLGICAGLLAIYIFKKLNLDNKIIKNI